MNMTPLQQFGHEWVAAWNSHDLDTIMSHYSEDIDFSSPIIRQMELNAEGRIRDKATLRAYFSRALEKYPDLHFELYHILEGVQSAVLYYKSVNHMLSAEYMELDAGGRICRVRAHYKPYADTLQLVTGWLACWSGGDAPEQVERLLDYYTEDCRYADPAQRDGLNGKAALRPYLQQLLQRNPRWRWACTELLPTPGGCVVRWEAQLPAGNNTVTATGLDILELEEGKISRNEVFFDRSAWLQALAAQKEVS